MSRLQCFIFFEKVSKGQWYVKWYISKWYICIYKWYVKWYISTIIKNGQVLLYCHFNKIIKELGTSFQSPAFSQKHVRNVCDTTH